MDLLCILIHLFVHSSGPFGGPLVVGGGGEGGSSEPREPPLATALHACGILSSSPRCYALDMYLIYLDL